MANAGVTADWPDWRDENSYAYTKFLTRRGWAWEFLRRNIGFQRDLSVVLEQAEYLERGAKRDIVKSPVDLTKWGVMFRGVFASRRGHPMVPASLPLCSPGNCRPRIAYSRSCLLAQ